MKTTSLAAFAASFSTAVNAVSQGFNYGSTFTDGTPKQQSDFENEFKTAQCLTGAPGSGFNSARLYTMVQGGTSNNPISAIPAAIATKTHLLLGLWASAGDAAFANELQALANAIATYGTAFTSLVDGISVGSEDLYRITPTGIQNGENPGAQPNTIVTYIGRVRNTISGTSLSGAPVGHVDTWTAWANSSNSAVVDACDWLGMDAYPYFQSTMDNSIANSKSLFDSAMAQTKAFAKGKSVWVTETGFPISGKVSNLATPSLNNAQSYWDQVGCPLFGNTNVWWYTLQDSAPSTPNPSFGIVGSTMSCTPVYDISCKNVDTSSSSSSASASASSTTTSTTTVTAGSSGTQSSASTTTEPSSLGGGSPGAGSGLGSSQLSLETSSISTASKPTGSTVSSSPTSGSGSGSGSGNSSISATGQPSPSASTVNSGAAATAGAAGAALIAVMGAVAVAL